MRNGLSVLASRNDGSICRGNSTDHSRSTPLPVAETEHGERAAALSSPCHSKKPHQTAHLFVLRQGLPRSTTPIRASSNTRRPDWTSPWITSYTIHADTFTQTNSFTLRRQHPITPTHSTHKSRPCQTAHLHRHRTPAPLRSTGKSSYLSTHPLPIDLSQNRTSSDTSTSRTRPP